ncbi:DUF3429 domain-containing protein [Paracoccaceae bacterium GXU_MW_L88]
MQNGVKEIPRPALILGGLGLIPFLWGALCVLFPSIGNFHEQRLPLSYDGITLLAQYGVIILSFMGGALWGFGATRGWLTLVVAVLPALWALYAASADAATACLLLAPGFALLLAADIMFTAAGLAPRWWPWLRVPLTAIVVLCLLTAAL